MSLKKKTIVMVCAVFFISAALNFAVQQLVIMPSFYELEREGAMDNIGRVLESINRELQIVSTTASDWSYWDDAYNFAGGKNPEFLESSLNQEALVNASYNMMNVYDTEGKLLWGKALDLQSEEILDLGDLSAAELPPSHPLRDLPEIAGEITGFSRTSHAPLMVAARHILTNTRTGPANGTFAVGRFMDESFIQHLAEQVRLQLTIAVIPDGRAVADWQLAAGQGVPHSPILLGETRETLVASTIIADISGQPFLDVRVVTPRAISDRGKSTVLLAFMSIGIAGLLVMGVLLLMLHFTILNPLATLTTHSVQLGETDDLLSRLTLNRRDEIGVLANAFDQMIGRLAEARRKLVDQSFFSGIAEMASGVLHNIGNALTPLQGQLVAVNDELRKTPVAEMKMALLELTDAATPMERRNDLSRFVELAGKEMAEAIGRSQKLVAESTFQVEYIHRILADQESYSRAARVLEPLAMDALVVDSMHTLSAPLRAAITVEIDPGVAGIGQVIGSRAALQQVVSNVLVNAAESIRESGMEGGRILVFAAYELVNGTPMAHFCFEDNGGGIKEEDLDHIFERSFSTKGRSTGLGLHWCANTVNALRGRIYVRNNEGTRGACLHLLLPLAAEQKQAGTTQQNG